MFFGQITNRDSLSDAVLCLNANSNKLYHLGIGNHVTLSTLTRANEKRSYLIYQELAYSLISEAKELYADSESLDFVKGDVFAIDATTIDLCVSTFYWAKFRNTKSGIKLHTLLDLKTSIPEFVLITNAKVHDVNALDSMNFNEDSFYIMDRGYVDFRRLYEINNVGAFYVTRSKDNMDFKRVYSAKVNKKIGVLCDQKIKLNGYQTSKQYPIIFRRIKYYDSITNKVLIFITNNFELEAIQIAILYKNRWQIELFFKWIKQHLKIKSYWGQSENAVKTQVWIAICTYVVIAIAKKRFSLTHSLYEILQISSVSIFERIHINQLFQQPSLQKNKELIHNQLTIWDL
jgi:hypothetical protein